MSISRLKAVAKSPSVEFDKYRAPVTVSTNKKIPDMVRMLLATEEGPDAITVD